MTVTSDGATCRRDHLYRCLAPLERQFDWGLDRSPGRSWKEWAGGKLQNGSRKILITSIGTDHFDEMQFGYEVIDDSLPCGRLGICQPTDLTGNGRSDIHAAEIGLGKREDESRTPSFRDQGDGEFVELLIHHGTPTHETKEIDMNDYGRTDIVSKSYGPDHYADIWYNEG